MHKNPQYNEQNNEIKKNKKDLFLRTSIITSRSLAESTLGSLIVSQRGSTEGTNVKRRRIPSSRKGSNRKLLSFRRSHVTLAEVEN